MLEKAQTIFLTPILTVPLIYAVLYFERLENLKGKIRPPYNTRCGLCGRGFNLAWKPRRGSPVKIAHFPFNINVKACLVFSINIGVGWGFFGAMSIITLRVKVVAWSPQL